MLVERNLSPAGRSTCNSIRMAIMQSPVKKCGTALPPLLWLCATAPAISQIHDSDSRYRETYAIVGARIEVGDGRVFEKGNVIVRNGRIESVGAAVPVPAYAMTIKGEGLTVYPGFIDAYSTKGLKLPEAKPDQDLKTDAGVTSPVSMRTGSRKNTRPELHAEDHLDLSQSFLIGQRGAGFTSMLAAPSGGIFSGMPAFINLAGRPSGETIVASGVGSAIGFGTSGDGYPGTPLGAMAHIRQAFMDAQTTRASAGPSDRVLGALTALLSGAMPAMVEANRSFEVVRALGLASQFGLKPIIVGGQEAYKEADLLKARGVPVILALNYAPEPKPKTDPKKPEKPATPEKEAPQTDDPVDVPTEALTERQTKWVDRVRTAKTLHEKGVVFAFSAMGAKDNNAFWKNLRRAVAEGLPKEQALKALTINAATIFKLDKELGTITVGKRANLTIMKGDFSKEGTKTRYVMIDGRLFDTETDKPPVPTPAPLDDKGDGR